MHRWTGCDQGRRPVHHTAAALLLLAGLCGPAAAQEAALNGDQLTAGVNVRGAFADVIVASRPATVRVLSDGKPVALGAVVAEDGLVLTKGSQLQRPVTCRLLDGREYEAEYVAYDGETDLALLKVPASGLTPVRWRDGSDASVGQWLATPAHLSAPVGVGIVSVARREIPFERISGMLGVLLEDFEGGARIKEVVENSAAAAADMQVGDLIRRVGENVIDGRESLIRLIREQEPGTTLQITVQRGESEFVIPATLTAPFGDLLSRIAEQNQMGGELSLRRTGFPVAIQHDTVLAPEDCGGPIVDLNGEAIGLNIARAGRTETYAIPADVILALLPDMQAGRFPPPWTAEVIAGPPAPPSSLRRSE